MCVFFCKTFNPPENTTTQGDEKTPKKRRENARNSQGRKLQGDDTREKEIKTPKLNGTQRGREKS